MSTADQPSRDPANWATSGQLRSGIVPRGAIDRNVDGKRVTSPLQGFGRLWQKTYRVHLTGCAITPQQVISLWKSEYATFWPRGSRFYGSGKGINPGDTALLNMGVGDATLISTGILVLYADEESFTFMTPEGHSFAGWITASAARQHDTTVARIDILIRASDPIYELGMAFGMNRMEDRHWQATLQGVAARVGCTSPLVETRRVCVDRRRQWANAGNIWQNSAVRTFAYVVTHPRKRPLSADQPPQRGPVRDFQAGPDAKLLAQPGRDLSTSASTTPSASGYKLPQGRATPRH